VNSWILWLGMALAISIHAIQVQLFSTSMADPGSEALTTELGIMGNYIRWNQRKCVDRRCIECPDESFRRIASIWIVPFGLGAGSAVTLDEAGFQWRSLHVKLHSWSFLLVDSDTVAYYKCNEGSGSTLHDETSKHDATLSGSPEPTWEEED